MSKPFSFFASEPTFALAGAGFSPPSSGSSSPITAMLGRGLGRGAPPVSSPAPASSPIVVPAPAPPDLPEAVPSVSVSTPVSALPPEFLDYIEAMGQNISVLREELAGVRGELSALNSRGSDSHRVFETLHAELADYKRDFIYEHVKPLLRPLLFLFDSLEGFDGEMKGYEDAQRGQTLPPDALKASKVRTNLGFLRDQLVEALGVCDVEPMPVPSGSFDAKTQKAIDTVPVLPALDGAIVEVIRIGWTMHGHLLRPAEVILGKVIPTPISAPSGGETL